MEQLNSYIQEGLLKNIGVGKEALKRQIEKWINENCYTHQRLHIKIIDHTFYVDADKIIFEEDATSLTNGQFKWDNVKWFECSDTKITTLNDCPRKCHTFICFGCQGLLNLNGSPKRCSHFDCSGCDNLTSLEGAPEWSTVFYCANCYNLITLKGAPQKCTDFYCSGCTQLTSLEGAPQKCREISCGDCYNLTTLKGAPQCKRFCYATFNPEKLKRSFTKEEIKEVTGAYRITF